VDWSRQEGLLQVVAIAASSRMVIALGPAAPASETDRFVLGVARARADLVLTSGAILRAEPGLLHRFSDDPQQDRALQRWRRERLGRDRPPGVGVLSLSGQIPADHPALRFASAGFVWTSRVGRARLGRRVGALEVIDASERGAVGAGAGVGPAVEPGARASAGAASRRPEGLGGAIAHALSSGAGTVLVEAGPTLARVLYPGPRRADAAEDAPAEPPAMLDELLLSCFGGTLDPAAVGPAFVSEAAVRACFPHPPSERRVEEPSGSWRFLRYRRASVSDRGRTDT
jgi:hypothetical protein